METVREIPIYIGKLMNQDISIDLKMKDFISNIDGVYYATGYIYNTSRFSFTNWVIKDDCGRSIAVDENDISIKYMKKLNQ